MRSLIARIFAVALTLSACIAADAAAAADLTLMEAYHKALRHAEDPKIAELDIDLARARFYRQFNLILPQVNFLVTHSEQDATGQGESGISSDFTRAETDTAKFTFTQPIFSGFKEFAALAASGADRRQQEHKYARAKELLYLDVANAYFAVIQNEKDLSALTTIAELLDKRIDDLEQRVSLGRSRDSEFQSAVTDLKLVEADRAQAEADAAVSRDLLEFYIGEPLNDQVLVDEAVVREIMPVEQALRYTDKRHDVKAAKNAFIVADKNVISAHSGLIPKVYADGNYYTHREGFQEGNDWDVTLTVDVPVFDAPNTFSNIKDAEARRAAEELRYAKAKRMAELEIRNTHDDLAAAIRIEDALQAATESLKKNYDLLSDEYKSNLVNNLDVLDALRRYQDALKRYYGAVSLARRMQCRYRIATGQLEDEL